MRTIIIHIICEWHAEARGGGGGGGGERLSSDEKQKKVGGVLHPL